jgi:hypothetical protein
MIKQTTLDELNRYVVGHIPTGDFLKAVLSNNLVESFARADDENLQPMFEIIKYCYNEIPSTCWGSPEKVEAWVEDGNKKQIERREWK